MQIREGNERVAELTRLCQAAEFQKQLAGQDKTKMTFCESLDQAVRRFIAPPDEVATVENLGKTMLSVVSTYFHFVTANCDVHSVGSTARGTQDLAPAVPDFDIWIVFNQTPVEPFLGRAQDLLPKFTQFVNDSPEFKAFRQRFLPEVKNVFLKFEPFRPFPKSIPHPENYIGKVYVSDQLRNRELLIDIGMVPTYFMKSGAKYTIAFLKEAANWSKAERPQILANIRLFKSLCKRLRIYDRRCGGIRSIGVEQLVIQSQGQLATLMETLYLTGVESDDDLTFTIKPLHSVVPNWLVANPGFDTGHLFHNVLNFLDRTTQNTAGRDGDHAWLTLATMARTFQRLKSENVSWTINSFISRVQSTPLPMIAS